MVSGTFDQGGATFVSGQDVEAFWNAIAHFPLLAVGMNCALGPELMRPHLEELQEVSPRVRSVAIPTPACRTRWASTTSARPTMAEMLGEFAEQRLGEHRRRLLRHDARPHSRDRRRGRAATSRTSARPSRP